MASGRPPKLRNDIPDEVVEQFIASHPNGATSSEIARYLGEPMGAFIQECRRLEIKLATLGRAYA